MPLPYAPMTISANLAMSIDGKIASATHCRSGWTSPEDAQRLIDLRRDCDALIVGHGTLRQDRMTLTCASAPRPPLRCVVSRRGDFDPQAPLFHRPGGAIHLLVTDPSISVPPVHSAATLHRGSLNDFLIHLAADLGVKRLHCEGGAELMQALFQLDAIDTLHLTWAGHRLFSGELAPTISGSRAADWLSSREYQLDACTTNVHGEAFLTYSRRRNCPQHEPNASFPNA